MAGVVLRAQDENNYYVVRASTEGNLLWYRVVGGKSYDMLGIGVKIRVPKDVWQELRVECKGSQTRCFLEGKLVIPPAWPARRPMTWLSTTPPSLPARLVSGARPTPNAHLSMPACNTSRKCRLPRS
jgi:hypothetical protein